MKRVLSTGLRLFFIFSIAFGTIAFGSASASAALPDWLEFWKDEEYQFNGGFYEPPRDAHPLTGAVDQHGEPFSFEEHEGKVIFLYFGYTHCPDACPATLSEWMETKELLGDKADDVVFAMLTVDPERDTPERMGEYLEFWDPTFYGVTMSEENTEEVLREWAILYSFEEPDQTGGYIVNHDVSTYVIGPDGTLRLTYPLGFDPELIAEDVEHLLDGD
jgi:protein SCO1/2